jgi:hypothetical protein
MISSPPFGWGKRLWVSHDSKGLGSDLCPPCLQQGGRILRPNTMPTNGLVFCFCLESQAMGLHSSSGRTESLTTVHFTVRVWTCLWNHLRPFHSPPPSLIAISHWDIMAGCPKTLWAVIIPCFQAPKVLSSLKIFCYCSQRWREWQNVFLHQD